MEEMAQFPEARVKEMDYGPHSEMGWVLARIREPNCGARGRYGWAIAEVNVSFIFMKDMENSCYEDLLEWYSSPPLPYRNPAKVGTSSYPVRT